MTTKDKIKQCKKCIPLFEQMDKDYANTIIEMQKEIDFKENRISDLLVERDTGKWRESQKQKIIEEIKSLDYDEMMSEDMETVDKKMFYESSMTEEDLESVKKYILKSIGEKEQ